MDKPPAETRINVWVNQHFYHQMKIQAALAGITLKAFVIEALKEKLKKK
jgi:predicted HicB family RNase H-like nuclease